MKIKFIKRSEMKPVETGSHIVITYSLFEIFLGILLLLSNIAVIYILVNYTIK